MNQIDRLNRVLWTTGWSWGPVLLRSERTRRALAACGSRWATGPQAPAVVSQHLDQWRRNVTIATGRRPSDQDLVTAARSYLRSVTESFVLPSWSPARIVSRVTTDPAGEQALRAAMATRGAVVALPHIGSWDHAGAWACATGMPVATVAEQLGSAEFAAFKGFRERLGFRVYSHRDPTVLRALTSDLRAGRLVCLVADRCLAGHGLVVGWPTPTGPVPVRIPAGPALLARQTDALLVGVSARFTPGGIHLAFSEPVEHRPGARGLVTMTQQLTDFFAAEVALHPSDWHVFQPFFTEEPR